MEQVIDSITRARILEHEEAYHTREEDKCQRTRAAFMENRAVMMKNGMTREQIAMGMQCGKAIGSSIRLDLAHRPDCWIGTGVVEIMTRKYERDFTNHVLVDADVLWRFRNDLPCQECRRLFTQDTTKAIREAREGVQ